MSKSVEIELCCGSLDRPSQVERRHDRIYARIAMVGGVVLVMSWSAFALSLDIQGIDLLADGWFSAIGLYALGFFLLARAVTTKTARWDRAFWNAVGQLSRERKMHASLRHGPWLDNLLDEIECDEAHLPGECPLCGAE